MIFYLGVKVPLANQWLEVTNISPHAAESDSAVQVVHDTGDFARAALRPAPSARREGTLDRLIGTPSPLDELLREDTLQSVASQASDFDAPNGHSDDVRR